MKILKFIILLPIKLAKKLYNWALSDKDQPNSFQKRFPNVIFSKIENIEIGERVFLGNGSQIVAIGKIIIGDDTMIAPNVMILTGTHSTKNHPMWKETIIRPVTIGKHVWIGANSIILPGVKIADFAVIGAGAVISRHVPERAIVVGNPAKIIKYRIINNEDLSAVYHQWAETNEGFLPDSFVTTDNLK
jgi:acetyltransferase-like isoleucine patch superfamily enzyme